MFAYLHKKCGKPAWLLRQEPIPGQRFLSQQCYTFDNQPLSFAAGCRCLSCGEVMFEDAAASATEENVAKISKRQIKQLLISEKSRNLRENTFTACEKPN